MIIVVFYRRRDRQALRKENRNDLFYMKKRYSMAGMIVLLPYERIISNPIRAAQAYSENALSDLVLSIQVNGVLEPVQVSVVNEWFYQIESGERRFRAAVMAGLSEIPCIVIGEENDVKIPYALIEDLHHLKNHYLEQAQAINTLLEEGYTICELSEVLSVPVQELREKTGLLRLSEDIQNDLLDHNVSEAYAKLLLKAEEGERRDVLDKILTEDLSLTEAKAYIHEKKTKEKRRQVVVFKDTNVFSNTIERTVSVMKQSGITASFETTETDEQIIYTINIRKNG